MAANPDRQEEVGCSGLWRGGNGDVSLGGLHLPWGLVGPEETPGGSGMVAHLGKACPASGPEYAYVVSSVGREAMATERTRVQEEIDNRETGWHEEQAGPVAQHSPQAARHSGGMIWAPP